MTSDLRSRATLISLFFLFLIVLVPGTGSHGDMTYWEAWAISNVRGGLSNTYSGTTDYLPLYHYVLYIYGILQGSEEAIIAHIRYLKVVTVLFDLIGLWVVYKWIEKKVDFTYLFFVCIFNPAFSYNSILWGQIDAIQSALVFAAFYSLFRRNIIVSVLLIILALNLKLQAIIFLPLYGIMLLDACFAAKKWKSLVKGIACALVMEVVILLPFIQNEAGREGLLNVITNSVGKFGYVTWFAYNFWCLFLTKSTEIPDSTIWFSTISYKTAGLVLFFTSSFFAMLPLLSHMFNNIFSKVKRPAVREQVWLSGALISILFFYLNTEMHERYSHPAFLFIIAYSFYSRRFFPLVLMSLAYFLNLEGILHWLRLNKYSTLIFDPAFVSSIYLILIIYLFYQLYGLNKHVRSSDVTIKPLEKV